MSAQSGFVTESSSARQFGWWRRHPYAAAALVALAVRVALIFIRRTYVFPASDPFNFGMESGSIARSLATGEGFSSPFRGSTGPTAWIAPLYPAMCAAVFRLLGVYSAASAICILALNSIFSALTCFAIGGIARRTVGDRVGIIGAFLWAVLPHFAKWPTEWAWDMSLSALLAGLAIWLTLLLDEDASWRRWMWFGTLWAAITLSNPSLLTLLPVCALWLAMRRHDTAFWRHAAVSALLCSALVAPWMVRNRMALGRWVFVRDNFGFELHMGNYHFSNGMGWRGTHPAANPAEYAKYRALGELRYIDETGRAAREFIRENPAEFASLCWIRATGFWNGSPMGYSPNPWPWTPGAFLFASLLALAGLLWATVSRMHGAALFWWMAIYPLPYYITYPQTRYRHAIEPEMVLLSVYVVAAVVDEIRKRRAVTSGRRPSNAAAAA